MRKQIIVKYVHIMYIYTVCMSQYLLSQWNPFPYILYMANLASKNSNTPCDQISFLSDIFKFQKRGEKVFRKYFAKLSLPRISKQVVEQEEDRGVQFRG